MKTMKGIFWASAMGLGSILLCSNALATDFLSVYPSSKEKTVKVEVKPSTLKDASISLSSMKGNVLHNESIKARTAYGKVYDFSKLEDGIYTFYSESDYVTTIKQVQVEKASVKILSTEVEYSPVFVLKNQMLAVNFFNKDLEDMEFSIENNAAVFYENEEGNNISFQKMLNISQMPPGEYYATLKVGGRTFGHTFTVD
jgi:hypothetical protein